MTIEALDTVSHGDGGGPDVRFGVLTGPTGEYPLVCGIPVFVPVGADVVRLLRAGRHQEATSLAAFGRLARSRRSQLLELATAIPKAGKVAAVGLAASKRRFLAAGEAAVFGSGGAVSPLDVLRFAFLDAPSRRVDAFDYFRFRYSMPRHLVALSCIEAHLPASGPVVDIGCGAGHLTWVLTMRSGGSPVVGVESELFLLLAARILAPDASFVCADATSLPFPTGWVDRLFAFDVLSFVTSKWGLARELDRVLKHGGRMALTSVKNSLVPHVHAGEPMTPAGWRNLVAHLPHRLLPDRAILDGYLQGNGLPAGDEPAPGVLADAQTLTILAAKGEGGFADGGPFDGWPHARDGLAVNPLYAPSPGPAGSVTYERRFPSDVYARDNPEMGRYLPERFELAAATMAAAAAGGSPGELGPLVASLAVLSLPDGLPGDRWPSAA